MCCMFVYRISNYSYRQTDFLSLQFLSVILSAMWYKLLRMLRWLLCPHNEKSGGKTVTMTVIRIQRKSKAERINECMKINRDNNEGTGFTTVQYYISDVCYLVCQGEESQVKGHFKDFHADVYPYLFCRVWYLKLQNTLNLSCVTQVYVVKYVLW